MAGAEGERNRFLRPPAPGEGAGAGSKAPSRGIQRRAPGEAANPPVRSMTVAPARSAAGVRWAANRPEPVKKTKRVRSKLVSSTAWMTAASPPSSVRVPASDSSSRRRISPAGKAAFLHPSLQVLAAERGRSGDGHTQGFAAEHVSDSPGNQAVANHTGRMDGQPAGYIGGGHQKKHCFGIDDDEPHQQRQEHD